MIVCSCKAIRDRDIAALVEAQGGAVRMRDLRECLGVCDNCGKCARTAYEVLRQSREATIRTDCLHSIERLRSGGLRDDLALGVGGRRHASPPSTALLSSNADLATA